MKKRYLALLLALVLGLPLAACTPKTPAESEPPAATDSTPPEETPAVSPSPEQSDPVEPVETPDTPADPEDPENVQIGDRETTLTVMVEGEEETIPALRHSSWLGYALTYDPDLLTLAEEDEADIYLGEIVPDQPNTYLSVSVVDGLTAEEAVEGLRIQLDIEDEGKVAAVGAHDYAATYLRMDDGVNEAVAEFYLTEQNGTVFLVELGYWAQAEEGLGARLHTMLDTLTF